MIPEGLHRRRNETLWVLDMGHLALENKSSRMAWSRAAQMPLRQKATAKEKRLMTSYESHILRITSPLETQSLRDSVTSAGKKA